jgi:ankyrin repeat protein
MAAPAALAAVDALHAPDPQTWDHVVRAAAHCGQLEAAAVLMRLCREHAHDPELLARTRGVRGGEYRVTLLMRAVERRDVSRAAEIVGACPTPASRAQLLACVNSGGWTALHLACNPNREDEDAAGALAEVLLGAGADPLAIDRSSGMDFQPIHIAAEWSAHLVQQLVAAGASIEGDIAGFSTLSCAASAGTARSVRMIPALVALGARETLGNGVMQRFARWPVKGAPPSDEEVRAALTALVGVGCSLTAPGAGGYSPMDIAAYAGNAPVVTTLLALGVAATTKSLAHAAVHPDVVRVLLAAGAPPGGLVRLAPGVDTVTPLMAAARASAVESARVLLAAASTSVLIRNERGKTALMHTLQSDSTDATAVLSVVGALLDAGADVAARDTRGNTPLHILAAHRAMQPWAVAVARLLLASGASGRQKNEAGKTPAGSVPASAARDGELYALLLAAEQA